MEHKTVPLKALEKERAKYKEKISKLQEELNMTKSRDGACMVSDETTTAKRQELEQVANLEETATQETKTDFLAEFAELIKNPIYSDAGDYLDDIKAYATDNNCNLKVAYNSLYAERKYDEIRNQAEKDFARAELSKPVPEIPTGIQGGISTAVNERQKLDKDHIVAAAKYGITIEEYMKYM